MEDKTKNKPFEELDSTQEENLSGGMASGIMPNLGIQNAVAISNSGTTTGGGNSNSGAATADNNNNP